jgi:hypothetical protein
VLARAVLPLIRHLMPQKCATAKLAAQIGLRCGLVNPASL